MYEISLEQTVYTKADMFLELLGGVQADMLGPGQFGEVGQALFDALFLLADKKQEMQQRVEELIGLKEDWTMEDLGWIKA